jgi:hypothetical protein
MSFIIGRVGMDMFIYTAKKFKILNKNLSLDKRFFDNQKKKIEVLENEIKTLHEEIESKDISIRLLKEA